MFVDWPQGKIQVCIALSFLSEFTCLPTTDLPVSDQKLAPEQVLLPLLVLALTVTPFLLLLLQPCQDCQWMQMFRSEPRVELHPQRKVTELPRYVFRGQLQKQSI